MILLLFSLTLTQFIKNYTYFYFNVKGYIQMFRGATRGKRAAGCYRKLLIYNHLAEEGMTNFKVLASI